MDAIRSHLFENPLYLYITLAVVELAAAGVWYSRRDRKSALALLPAPVLAVAIGLTAWLVRTDREEIAAVIQAVGAAVERRDLAAVGEHVDANCRSPGSGRTVIGKDELMAIARAALARWTVTEIRLRNIETELAGANATTLIDSRVFARSDRFGQQVRDIGWQLQWARRPAGWKITRLAVTYPEFLKNLSF